MNNTAISRISTHVLLSLALPWLLCTAASGCNGSTPPTPILAKADMTESAILPWAGHWEGAIDDQGSPRYLQVDFTRDGTGGLLNLRQWDSDAVSPIDVSSGSDAGHVRFILTDAPPSPKRLIFEGSASRLSIVGRCTDAKGRLHPFYLTRQRLAAVHGPPRPQTPKEPFPYDVMNVKYTSAGATIAGTFSTPRSAKGCPAVFVITGGHHSDRDASGDYHKPYLVLADALTRAGIAVLRVDSRGVGGSTGRDADCTLEQLTEDAIAGVQWLRSRKEVDPGRVGVLGGSVGGTIAVAATARCPDVAFAVLLSTPCRPFGEIIAESSLPLSTKPTPAEQGLRAVLADTISEGFAERARPFSDGDLLEIIHRHVQVSEAVEQDLLTRLRTEFLAGADNPVRRSFYHYVPANDFKKIHVPVLAVFGELDHRLSAHAEASALDRIFQGGRHASSRVVIFPEMNHRLQTCQRGDDAEAARISETMSNRVLETVSTWVSHPAP